MSQATKTTPARLFFAYAHEDENSRDELAKHLAALKSAGLIADWHDRRIVAGSEWDGEINKQLKQSDVVLLLISADFLDSEYCMGIEFKEALKLQKANAARVIPVIIRPALWQLDDRLSALQVLPKDGKPVALWEDEDVAYLNIADGIRRAVLQMRANRARTQVHKTQGKSATGSAAAKAKAELTASTVPISKGGFAFKRVLKQSLITTIAIVVGALLGHFGYQVFVKAQNQQPNPSLSNLFAIAGAITCGVLSFIMSGLSKSKLVQKVSQPESSKPSTVPARKTSSEVAKWRAIAGRQYERKELFKAAFIQTRERLSRSRAVFWVAALVALAHIVTAAASSLILSSRGGAKGDDPVVIKYLQSIMLFGGVALVAAGVFTLYCRHVGGKRSLFSAFLIGGCGTFLAGLFFLFQVTPELADLIIKSDPGVLTVVPGLPQTERYKVSWLAYFVIQKLAVLPTIGMIAAMLVMPLLRRKQRVAT